MLMSLLIQSVILLEEEDSAPAKRVKDVLDHQCLTRPKARLKKLQKLSPLFVCIAEKSTKVMIG